MSKKFNWIHISDLHLKEATKWESDEVTKELISKLKLLQFRPDAIFFTGDAVFGDLPKSPISQQFKDFGKFLDSIRNAFTPILPKKSIFIVPGNHDVNRSQVTEAEDQWLSNSDNTIFDITDKFKNQTRDASLWMKRLDDYRKFLKDYGLDHLEPDNFHLIWRHKISLGKHTISVLGLNSSWSCCKNNEKGSLRMSGKWQLTHLLKEVDNSDFVICLLHHPSNWLHESEDPSFGRLLNQKCDLILHGHEHEQFLTNVDNSTIVSAGACYDSHDKPKAFSTGKVNSSGKGNINLYRWDDIGNGWIDCPIANIAPKGKFSLTGKEGANRNSKKNTANKVNFKAIKSILETIFKDAATCYSSYQGAWVERQFSITPEVSSNGSEIITTSIEDLVKEKKKNTIIHAPINFGLTCVGRRIALKYFEINEEFYLYLRQIEQPHKESVLAAINAELQQYEIDIDSVIGIIFDNAKYCKKSKRIIKSLQDINENWHIISLNSRDDMSDFSLIGLEEVYPDFKSLHLWSLSRSDVRHLLNLCVSEDHVLTEESLVNKIINDLDALNIHRTPLNCLTLLKINENQIDDTPVNRTEMIKRVLGLFFNQFNQVPRYSERPDLIDCEYTLGYFAEDLIRSQEYSFTKNEFISICSTFAKKQKIPLEADVLFLFIATEKIIVARDGKFEFRFAYWLHYFAAHRMHHSEEFRSYILDNSRYVYFPEIIEFYSGIDRRRDDAVGVLIEDLKRLNSEFSVRSGIPENFDPYISAEWNPSGDFIDDISNEINDGAHQSNLTQELKDTIADHTYDRSKAYNQEMQAFIKESTLPELFQAIKGAARTLRNSDYVAPSLKADLLNEVMNSWKHVAQALFVISPVLAHSGKANFEGMGFILLDFDSIPKKDKFFAIIQAIPTNIVNWFEEDIHSKKLGPICIDYFDNSSNNLSKMLLRRALIKHKPAGYLPCIKNFLVNESKNSFYLLDCFRTLRNGYRYGVECESKPLKELAAIALAKHSFGMKNPDNRKVKKKAIEHLDKIDNENQ